MAQKKEIAKKPVKPAAPAAKETSAPAKTNKNAAADKLAKRKARLEALKQREPGQRPNSKTIDVIPMENGSKVLVYAQPVRKFGLIITSVAVDADGNVLSTSTTTLAGYRVKAKKGHGTLVLGAPGLGKKGKNEDEDEGDEEEAEDEDED